MAGADLEANEIDARCCEGCGATWQIAAKFKTIYCYRCGKRQRLISVEEWMESQERKGEKA